MKQYNGRKGELQQGTLARTQAALIAGLLGAILFFGAVIINQYDAQAQFQQNVTVPQAAFSLNSL